MTEFLTSLDKNTHNTIGQGGSKQYSQNLNPLPNFGQAQTTDPRQSKSSQPNSHEITEEYPHSHTGEIIPTRSQNVDCTPHTEERIPGSIPEPNLNTDLDADKFERHAREVTTPPQCKGVTNWLEADGTITRAKTHQSQPFSRSDVDEMWGAEDTNLRRATVTPPTTSPLLETLDRGRCIICRAQIIAFDINDSDQYGRWIPDRLGITINECPHSHKHAILVGVNPDDSWILVSAAPVEKSTTGEEPNYPFQRTSEVVAPADYTQPNKEDYPDPSCPLDESHSRSSHHTPAFSSDSSPFPHSSCHSRSNSTEQKTPRNKAVSTDTRSSPGDTAPLFEVGHIFPGSDNISALGSSIDENTGSRLKTHSNDLPGTEMPQEVILSGSRQSDQLLGSDYRSCHITPIETPIDTPIDPSDHCEKKCKPKHKRQRKSRNQRSKEKKRICNDRNQATTSTHSSVENSCLTNTPDSTPRQIANDTLSDFQKGECRMARKPDSMISQRTCLPDAIRSLLGATMDTATIYSSMVSCIPSDRYCTSGDMKEALKPHRIQIQNVTRKYRKKGGYLFHLFQETECQLIITVHLVNHEDIHSFHCVSWNGNTIEDQDFSCAVNDSSDKQIHGSKEVLQKMFVKDEYKEVQITRVFEIKCVPK
jgi:hypothetical protein